MLLFCAQGIKKGDTWFGIALKVVRALLKRKIISSPNDQTAVIFYGTVRLISQPVPNKTLQFWHAQVCKHARLDWFWEACE